MLLAIWRRGCLPQPRSPRFVRNTAGRGARHRCASSRSATASPMATACRRRRGSCRSLTPGCRERRAGDRCDQCGRLGRHHRRRAGAVRMVARAARGRADRGARRQRPAARARPGRLTRQSRRHHARPQARGLPVLMSGMQAPLNYGPDFKRRSTPCIPNSPRSMTRSTTRSSWRRREDDRALWQR
jgi:hypothetical protein